MRKSSLACVAIGAVAGVTLATGTAIAATGGTFILGRTNYASNVTILKNANGTALTLSSPLGSPPLVVNNTTKVPKLNADLLDGKTGAAFLSTKRLVVTARGYGVTATCPSGSVMTGGGAEADPKSWLYSSKPSGNGWTASAYVIDTSWGYSGPDAVTVYAICMATG